MTTRITGMNEDNGSAIYNGPLVHSYSATKGRSSRPINGDANIQCRLRALDPVCACSRQRRGGARESSRWP